MSNSDHTDHVHKELLWAEKRLEVIFERNAAGIFVVDDNRYIIMVNQRFCNIVGYGKEELIGQHACFLHTSTASCMEFRRYFLDAQNGLQVKVEYVVGKKGGDRIWVELFGSKIELDETHNGVIWSIIDISERKAAEEIIRNLAFYDTLTGLTNRRLFDDRISVQIANKKRSNSYGAVLFLDLDNFKSLNDSFGHRVGDAFLVEVARRLLSCVRGIDTVSRFGGDEFVVLVNELNRDKKVAEEQVSVIARRILAKLREPYLLTLDNGNAEARTIEHVSAASIGISLFGKEDDEEGAVLHRADEAMYLVKNSGKNNYAIR